MIAIITDIHANLNALKTVIQDIEQYQIEEIYCLGDIVNMGNHPNEVIDLLIKKEVKSIIGNHDIASYDPIHRSHLVSKRKLPFLKETVSTINEKSIHYLKTLPRTLENDHCYFVHASPPDSCKISIKKVLGNNHFENIANLFKPNICFVGHTHKEIIYTVPNNSTDNFFKIVTNKNQQKNIIISNEFQLNWNQKYIINVGSVGLSGPYARYAIFDPLSNRIIFRHIKYLN